MQPIIGGFKLSKNPYETSTNPQRQTMPIQKAPAPLVGRQPFENMFIVLNIDNQSEKENLRQIIVDMGGTYQQLWNSKSTHLICKNANVPEYRHASNASVLIPQYIFDCFEQKKRLSEDLYKVKSPKNPNATYDLKDLEKIRNKQ